MSSNKDKREAILKAAIKVFSQNGFYKAKISEIAREANIGKGTIYEYFDSKKKLFQEMIKHIMNYHKRGIREILEGESRVKVKILRYLEYNVNALSNHLSMFKVMVSEAEELSAEMRMWLMEVKLEIFTMIEGIIEEGIKTEELRKDLNIEIAALSVIGTTNQYCAKKVIHDNLKYDEINLESVVETLFKGFE